MFDNKYKLTYILDPRKFEKYRYRIKNNDIIFVPGYNSTFSMFDHKIKHQEKRKLWTSLGKKAHQNPKEDVTRPMNKGWPMSAHVPSQGAALRLCRRAGSNVWTQSHHRGAVRAESRRRRSHGDHSLVIFTPLPHSSSQR